MVNIVVARYRNTVNAPGEYASLPVLEDTGNGMSAWYKANREVDGPMKDDSRPGRFEL